MPVIGAPLAHICVTGIRKYPQLKKPFFAGTLLFTFTMVFNRMVLMNHAGYAGFEGEMPSDRFEQARAGETPAEYAGFKVPIEHVKPAARAAAGSGATGKQAQELA